MKRTHTLTATLASAALIAVTVPAAQAAAPAYQVTQKDPAGDVELADKKFKRPALAKKLADLRGYTFSNVNQEGQFLAGEFQLSRVVGDSARVNQLVYIAYTDAQTGSVAGSIVVDVNERNATVQPDAEGAEFHTVDAVVDTENTTVKFVVDKDSLMVNQAKFVVAGLVEYGEETRRSGRDIAFDDAKISKTLDLTAKPAM